jgi:hypothetical protein
MIEVKDDVCFINLQKYSIYPSFSGPECRSSLKTLRHLCFNASERKTFICNVYRNTPSCSSYKICSLTPSISLTLTLFFYDSLDILKSHDYNDLELPVFGNSFLNENQRNSFECFQKTVIKAKGIYDFAVLG